MRTWIVLLLVGVILGGGCAGNGTATFETVPANTGAVQSDKTPLPAEGGAITNTAELIITPDHMLVGRVVAYNEAGRFVVLDFPLGELPAVERRMFLYRAGLKVGEVRINSWQREHFIVADLVAGEARQGDQVRAR
ncbi:MAG: hypothetical protein KIS67_13410 [Verrucomicrobiae bacterium]|nr:hypothetical protein [Verrucomicrobiae bacterium]